MKKTKLLYSLLIATCCFAFSSITNAQVEIHRGDNLAAYTCLYSVNGNKIFPGINDDKETCLYVIEGNRIYKGKYVKGDKSNCVYTIKNNKIYMGNSTSSTNLLYTVEGNQVFKGKECEDYNLLYTFDNQKVFTSAAGNDCFVSVNGEIDLSLLVCILEIDFIDFYEN